MKQDFAKRGAAPVGFLKDLDSVEAASVVYLRLWCDGATGQTDILNDFSSMFGQDRGTHMMNAFEQLCTLCVTHGRRPLMRHSVNCKCLGSDESCFANFIGTASEGEHEDAMLIATLLVSAQVAPMAAGLAAEVGMAFRQMQLAAPRDLMPSAPASATLH